MQKLKSVHRWIYKVSTAQSQSCEFIYEPRLALFAASAVRMQALLSNQMVDIPENMDITVK